MRRLFAEAKIAWEEGDRAEAKALSEKAHAEQAKSESHNAEANDLRVRRGEIRTKLAVSRQKLAEKQEARRGSAGQRAAPTDRSINTPLFAAHGARLVGFELARGLDASKIQTFFSRLPSSPFAEINVIEYVDIVDEERRAGVTKHITDRSRKTDIQLFRYPIDIGSAELVYHQAWTLIHEYGHVAFDRTIDANTRHEWGSLYLERRGDPESVWISERARTSLREDFSECLAAYRIRPRFFASADREKYDMIEKIYRML